MEERRKATRIALKIVVKGFINSNGNFLRVAGCIENLSHDGARIQLTKDTSAMLIEFESKGDSLTGSEVMLTLVSYIEDNIAATGSVSHIKENDSAMSTMGVEFNPLDKKSASILDIILKMSPELCDTSDGEKKEIVTRFGSFKDFLAELTQFAILSDKASLFWIGDERYVFVGMHKGENDEVHGDCIESVDNPGKVYCPDCEANIEDSELM